MTDAVIDRMQDPRHRRILQFVRYTIAADLARERPQRSRPLNQPAEVEEEVDVERLFASVDLLVNRNDQPWSPFVATWHPGLESFTPTPRLREFDLSRQLDAFDSAVKGLMSGQSRRVSTGFGTSSIRSRLWQVIEGAMRQALPSDVSKLLDDVRGAMLRSLFGLLSIDDPSTVAYLTPLIELGQQQRSLTIATLNYDTSIENAADLSDEPCDTGIETWLKEGALTWPDVGLRLLKLHGSIDWVVEPPETKAGELPRQRIRKVTSAEEKQWYDAPAVVFGEAGKLRSEGPYLELLLAWLSQLQLADSLLVVGYSFRDDHVNEVIARWFNADKKRRIVVVDPSDPASSRYDSFAWTLGEIDRLPGQSAPPTNPRFHYIAGTTAGALERGIATASASA
jgi:SIR2-like domain